MTVVPRNDELGVPGFLARCVGGFPPNVLPSVAIAGHRIAWRRFQETGDPEWRDVSEMCVRAITFARTMTAADADVIVKYLLEIPVSAWFTATGWKRRQVKSSCLAAARRERSYLEQHPQA